ncbi:unnamed protein product, partial [Amoebophrya sp. A25]
FRRSFFGQLFSAFAGFIRFRWHRRRLTDGQAFEDTNGFGHRFRIEVLAHVYCSLGYHAAQSRYF